MAARSSCAAAAAAVEFAIVVGDGAVVAVAEGDALDRRTVDFGIEDRLRCTLAVASV